MWILVYIYLNGMNPISVNAMGPYVAFDNMYECFQARERLSVTVGGENGYFPDGSQAICIYTNGGRT